MSRAPASPSSLRQHRCDITVNASAAGLNLINASPTGLIDNAIVNGLAPNLTVNGLLNSVVTTQNPVPGETLVVPTEDIDLVSTKDNGDKPLQWIGSRRLDAVTFRANPHLKAIRIRAGALGDGIPSSDLLVSPQHRVLVRSKIAIRMFDAREVLVAAKQLLSLDGIDIADDLETVEIITSCSTSMKLCFPTVPKRSRYILAHKLSKASAKQRRKRFVLSFRN